MTDANRDSRGRFLPGNTFSRGRVQGARNVLGHSLIEALAADFTTHGGDAVREVREARPVDYLKICLSLLPKDYTLTINPIADLSDDELHARLQELNTALTEDARGAFGGDGRDGAAAEDHEPGSLQSLPAPK